MVLALRRKANLKVRQPLSTIMVPVMSEAQKADIEAMSSLILSEVNVKNIKFVGNEDGVLVKRVKPDFNVRAYGYSKLPELLAAFPNKYQIKRYEGKGGATIIAYKCR